MRSIQELKEKQSEYGELYKKYINSKELNDFDQKEKCIIAGHWVDFIDDLLDYNFCEYMEAKGYTEDDIGTTFSSSEPEVQKAIIVREDQALKELESRRKYCQEHPYGVTHHMLLGGIFLEKLEMDILKWTLEVVE